MKKLRLGALILCLTAAFTGLSSCGSAGNAGKTAVRTAESEISAATEQTAAEASPQLPDKDMEGKSFNIFSENWYDYTPLDIDDITAEELNGESLNDAVYNRCLELNNKFNCTVTQADMKTDAGKTTLQKTIASGDDAYSIALLRANQYNTFLASGGMLELTKIPYIDLTAGWYDGNSLQALAILNRDYGVVSNITMNSYMLIFCEYFNLKMAENYQLGSIYDTVRSGKWTLDTMYNYGKKAAADLDSDGEYTSLDRYGFTYIIDVPEGLLNAGEVRYATLGADGVPEISYDTADALTKMQHLMEILSDTQTSFNVHKRSKQATVDEVGMFINGQALFSIAGIYYAPQFRSMEDNFGIIPLPKYNEEQENYGCPLFCNPFPITVIPVTNGDLEDTGMIMEEMSYLGFKELLPALYDTLLQGKITRDEDSNAMLDTIFGNTFYDTGLLFNFGGCRDTVRELYKALKPDFTSAFEKINGKVEDNINTLIEEIKSNG